VKRDIVADESWMEYANCLGLDPDWFFPGRGMTDDLRQAKAVCAACSVREQCLEYALNPKRPMVYGVFGGTSERERRQIRAARRREQVA
jgi:WhiB family transcriptional regulator, redox-sensing transcriptional regulator